MRVGTFAYYACKKRPLTLISAETLHLYCRMKVLFKQSRDSLSSHEIKKKLREEGFTIGRYKVRKLIEKLKLIVKQRITSPLIFAYLIFYSIMFGDLSEAE